MKRTMKTVDKYLSDMKKLEDIVKRNKQKNSQYNKVRN